MEQIYHHHQNRQKYYKLEKIIQIDKKTGEKFKNDVILEFIFPKSYLFNYHQLI